MVMKPYRFLSGFTLISNSHYSSPPCWKSLLITLGDFFFFWIYSWHAWRACYNNYVRNTFNLLTWQFYCCCHVSLRKTIPFSSPWGSFFVVTNARCAQVDASREYTHQRIFKCFSRDARDTCDALNTLKTRSPYTHKEGSRSINRSINLSDVKKDRRGTKRARDVCVMHLKRP